MAKRFGRNQRRQLREQIAMLERSVASSEALVVAERERSRRQLADAREQSMRELVALRNQGLPPDLLRIDLSTAYSPADMSLRFKARCEELRTASHVYAAQAFDYRDLEMMRDTRERDLFVRHVGDVISNHLYRQVSIHFRR